MPVNAKSGFILERILIALIIVCMFVPICTVVIKLLSNYQENYQLIQDQISIIQLRRVLLCGQDIEISDNELTFNDNNETRTLYLVNNHLSIKPGSLFVLVDIDDVYFEQDNNLIYLNYLRNDIWYKEVITNV